MRFSGLLAGLLVVAAVAPAHTQTRDCPPPPVQDRADFGLPCFTYPPTLGTEAKVLFAANASTLSDDARIVLGRQVEALKASPGLKVTLFGHSDPTEPAEIALRRAEAVRDYLVAQGIPASRLTVASRGSRAVIALKPSEDAFAAMRFVSTEPQEGQ